MDVKNGMFTVPNNSLWYIWDIMKTVALILNIFPKYNSEKYLSAEKIKGNNA